MSPSANVTMLILAMLAGTMVSAATSTTTQASTTSETYFWHRCQTGEGSGPRGYTRLCDGDNHGECVGNATNAVTSAKDVDHCAEKCDDVSECAGFEYDNHGNSEACTLFRFINGLNLTTESHLNTHECYTKEEKKVNYCESTVAFSGRYKRMCDIRYHGLCRGDRLNEDILTFESVDLCAAECDRTKECGGFDYDVHDESEGCDLYGKVTGAEQSPYNPTFECYAKENFVEPTTTTTTKAASTLDNNATSTVPASNSSLTITSPPSTTSVASTDSDQKASSGSAVTIGLIALTTVTFVITA